MTDEKDHFSASDPRVASVVDRIGTRRLCDHCLGRLVGKIGHGYTNDQRGEMIRDEKSWPAMSDDEKCSLCEGLFENMNELVEAVKNELSKVDFETFAVGSRYDPLLIEREEGIWSEVGAEHAEPIKAEVNREVGKRVEKLCQKLVDIGSPNVTAIIDINFLEVQLEIAPIFIYGRYRKYDRTIPQTKWPCRKCKGKGCERCNFTGKIYEESIEELIRGEFMSVSGATESAFHGMGREDIDAVMLGNGRPFVLELKNPKFRRMNLGELAERTNGATSDRVEIFDLRLSSRDEVRKIKDSRAEKSYRVFIQLDSETDSTKLKEVIRLLTESPIEQRTPNRVSHRRADKVRRRKIIEAELEALEGTKATIRIRASAGTYIKELVHGDEGNTKPSLAGLLDKKVDVLQLDVIGIHDESG